MIQTVSIGAKEEPYPMISNVWDFFSTKGTKTVFVSVGTGKTCVPDLEFAETIGCPILKLDSPEDTQKWQEVKEILKTRKLGESTSDFAKAAATIEGRGASRFDFQSIGADVGFAAELCEV